MEHWDVEIVSRRGTSRYNEDAFLALGRLFAVFDGTTRFAWPAENEVTPGRVAASCARTVFARRAAQLEAGSLTLRDVACEANEAIGAWNRDRRLGAVQGAATSCAAILVDEDQVKWIQCSDSLILGVDQSGSGRWYTENRMYPFDLLSMREMEAAIARGATTRAELLAVAEESDRRANGMANRPGGYGLLDGNAACGDHLATGSFDAAVDELRALILLTDGLIVPGRRGSGGYLDYDRTVDCLRNGPIEALLETVVRMTDADPECTQYPRFKPRDDATGILFRK